MISDDKCGSPILAVKIYIYTWNRHDLTITQRVDTGEIPRAWSLANICPLFKKSDRSLACNYRPVSLTCTLQVTRTHSMLKYHGSS